MSEWKEYRVKDIAYIIGSGTTPNSGNEKYYEDGVHHWINTGDLNNSEVFGGKKTITDLALKEVSSLRFYPIDTVLVAMYGASIGKTGLLKVKATVNQACCAIVPNNHFVTPEFLFYRITDYKDKLICESFGGTQPNVSQTIVANIKLTFPSVGEQLQIVSYLDTQTAAIDKRVAVSEKKQEVYSRLRKSIINRTVTRGLNPNVSLKDSGVDWIGKIPEHWEVRRFKELFTNCTTGITPDSKNDSYFDTEEGYTWVTIGDMNGKYTSDSQLKITPKVTELFSPTVTLKGSLMFSFKLSIGKLSFAEKDLYTNEAIMSIRSTSDINLEYIYYILPDVLNNNATENIYGAKMLNQKIIANMIMFIPPLSEQRAIADYLDDKCAKIDAAVENIGKQIDALKRLKRALINEVVTGKRKV